MSRRSDQHGNVFTVLLILILIIAPLAWVYYIHTNHYQRAACLKKNEAFLTKVQGETNPQPTDVAYCKTTYPDNYKLTWGIE